MAYVDNMGFPSDSAVKNLPAVQEMLFQPLCQEDPPEESVATHSSILARDLMDRGGWEAVVHGATESDMTDGTEHACRCVCILTLYHCRYN